MKILYVTTLSNLVDDFLVPHIRMLIEQGHSVDVAFHQERIIKDNFIAENCRVIEIPFSRNPISGSNIFAYHKLKKVIKQGNYDLVHTHTPNASAITRLVMRKRISKLIYTAHGLHFQDGDKSISSKVFKFIEKKLSKYTDAIITMNNDDYLVCQTNGFKFGKIFKIKGVGVDISNFAKTSLDEQSIKRNELGLNDDDFVIFYAAEINKNKNQILLLKTLKQLDGKIKVVFAGTGPQQMELQTYVAENELSKSVQFLGFRRDVTELLDIANLVVATSNREGLPLNIMEAMAAGVPVIATNIRGHKDLIVDQENGLLFEKNNIDMLVHKINFAVNNPDILADYALKSKEIIKGYSYIEVLEDLSDIYNQVMS